jgi:hypothetical protein
MVAVETWSLAVMEIIFCTEYVSGLVHSTKWVNEYIALPV